MGQYYAPVSIEKKQSVYSHDYGNGLKLMEHSWITNAFVAVVEGLISKGGAWYGTRIVWAGDYADPEPNTETVENPDGYNLWDLFTDEPNRIKPEAPKRKGLKKLRYLKNLDTNEFVDLNKVPITNVYKWKDKQGKTHESIYRIHPLPLMTCDGNGRGGGDYRDDPDNPLVGMWARNRVVMQSHKPQNAKEIVFDLIEKRF